MPIQTLKVAADPRFIRPEHSPYHQRRFIVTSHVTLETDLTEDESKSVNNCHNASIEVVEPDSGDGGIIAKMTDCEHQEQYANLFAAAPEMFEALLGLVREMAVYHAHDCGCKVCKQLHQAIAKAKGEA